jgi:UDP-N-acetylmuramoylalanine--D-glutamate ligase
LVNAQKQAFYQMKVILGLGKTGYSCCRYLAAMNQAFCVVDSRLQPPYLKQFNQRFGHIPVHLGSFPAAILNQAESLIISPGIAPTEPNIARAIANGIPVSGDLDLFCQGAGQRPVIAITGSNGKSTVTSLVAAMAKTAGVKVAVGGNLGTPMLDLLLEEQQQSSSKSTAELFVLELSSFQLENCYELSAQVATILNLSPDHLDRHPSYQDYCAAKQRIYNQAKKLVVNRNDPLTYPAKTIDKQAQQINSFGLDKPKTGEFGLIKADQSLYLALGDRPLIPTNQLTIKGMHNVANALAALALGQAAQLPMEAMLATLKTFSGLPHRCQWVATINGVDFINDSKATNVGATIAAVQGLAQDNAGQLVLIAGGIAKDSDFKPLAEVLQNCPIRGVILIGQDADQLAQALKPCPLHPHHATSLEQAVKLATTLAKTGGTVLLSPACASFDMFANFAERGDCFIELVRSLAKN